MRPHDEPIGDEAAGESQEVGRGQLDRKRQTVSVGQQLMLASGTPAIAMVGSTLRPPLLPVPAMHPARPAFS